MKNEKKYLTLSILQSLSSIGSSTTAFALSLWLYRKTGESWVIGYLFFASLTPRIYFSLFAGWIVDYFGKKRLLIFSSILQIILTLIFTLLFILSFFEIGFYLLFIFVFSLGVVDAIQVLVYASSTRLFIAKERLLFFNGWLQIIQGTPSLIAPVLGVILLDHLGINMVLFLDLLSFFPLLVFVLFMKFPLIPASVDLKKQNIFMKIQNGMNYLQKQVELKASLIFFIIQNFLGSLTLGLVTAFIIENAGSQSWLISVNSVLTASGVVLGSLFLSRPIFIRLAPFNIIILSSIFSAIIGRIIPGFFNLGLLIGVCLLFRNLLITIMNSANDTIWQTRVPLEFQGSAFGARRFFAQGFIPIGLLLGPALVKWGVSIAELFLFIGALEALTATVLWFKFRNVHSQ